MQQIGLRAVIDLSNFNKGVKQYNSGIGKMNKDTSGFTSTAAGHLSTLGGNIVSLGATAAKVAAGGVAVLGAALATFAVGGIKQATSLDQQMADIASVMSKTKDAVTPLKQEILDLSLDPQLRVNATQAAQAVELLARNGLDMTEIMAGAAKSTIALANATKADFGVAADVATDAMDIFNIEANNMGRAVDGITGVTTHSKLTIDDYALALGAAGAVGEGMGLSLEDLNTVLAATASSFTSGRVAGTSLKVLLQRLAKPTDEMQQAMDKYGISLFDSEGNMRSMSEIAGQLNNVFQGTATITETVGGATAEQAKLAKDAATKMDDLRASLATNQAQLALYNDELALQIQYYGEGSPKVRQRQIQIDKLSQTIDKQTRQLGEYESAIIAVEGSQARQITKTIELTEAEKANLAAVLGGADGARQIIALSKLTADEFDNLSGEVNKQGQALRAAATRVDSLQGAWDIFKSVVQAVQIQVGDKFLPVLRSVTVGFTDLAAKYGPMVIDFFGRIAGAISGVVSRFSGLIDLFKAGGLQALLTGGFIGEVGWGGVQVEGLLDILGLSPENQAIALDVINRIIEGIKRVGQAIGALSVGNTSGFLVALGLTPEMSAQIVAIGNNIINTVTSIITMVSNAISSLSAGDTGGFLLALGLTPETAATILTIGEVINGVFNGVVAVVMQAFGSLQGSFDQMTGILNQFGLDWGDVFTALGQATGIVLTAIGALIVGLVGIIAGAFNGIAAVVQSLIDSFNIVWIYVEQAIGGAAQIFVGFQEIVNNFGSDWGAVWDGVGKVLLGAYNLLQGTFNAILLAMMTPLRAATAFVSGWIDGIVTYFQGLYTTLVGASIVPDLVNGIVGYFLGMVTSVTDAVSGLVNTIGSAFASLLGFGGEEGASFGLDISGFIKQLPTATDAVNVFYENLTLQTTTFLEGVWLTLETRFMNFIIITLPQLQMAYSTAFQQMINITQQLMSVIQQLLVLIIQIGTTMQEAAKVVLDAVSDMIDAFDEAKSNILNNLLPAFDHMIERLHEIERAANSASAAISGMGSTPAGGAGAMSSGIGFKRGLGFQGGLGLGYKVPSKFANDSFGPFYASAGEEMLISPRGTSIENLIFSRLASLLGSVRGGSVQAGKSVQINFNAPISISNGMDWDTFQAGVKRTVAGAF